MSMKIIDYRKRGHKGTHVVFWESHVTPYHRCEVFSSLRSALEMMRCYSFVAQYLHDASGRLIAYTNNCGKVVMCNAHR